MEKDNVEIHDLDNDALNDVLFNVKVNTHEKPNVICQDYANKTWLIGHKGDIDEAGKYVAFYLGEYPLILLNNAEENVRVINNSCRHRGSTICQENRGQVASLVCPYHQWTYDLDGNLKYAHLMSEDIDCDDYSLKTFNSKISHDLIYVNLKEEVDASVIAHEYTNEEKYRVILKAKKSSTQVNLHALLKDYEAMPKDIQQQLKLEKQCDEKRYQLADNAIVHVVNDFQFLFMVLPNNQGEYDIYLSILIAQESLLHKQSDDILNWPKFWDGEFENFFEDDVIIGKELVDYTQQDNEEVLDIISNLNEQPTRLEKALEFENIFSMNQVWDSKLEDLTCVGIVHENHNIRTFSFRSENATCFQYKPGQFITLELPISEDEKVLRTYTLSSSPSRPLSISITVKLNPGSIGTKWMFDNLKLGDTLKAYGPAGEFSFFNQPSDKYLFISAGSGVTPMLSMTRWMFDYGKDMDIDFIHCARTPEDLIFKSELEGMAQRCQNLSITWVCESDPDNNWTGIRGRFNKLILGLVSQDYMDRDVYCCGPPPFMKAVRDALYVSGFDMQRYYEESFVSPEQNVNPFVLHELPDDESKSVVKFSVSNKEIELPQNESLLVAAKKVNIAIPSACGFGVCGTCKVKLNKGQAHMVHSGGISQKEIDEGYVLACCSTPLEDLEIDL